MSTTTSMVGSFKCDNTEEWSPPSDAILKLQVSKNVIRRIPASKLFNNGDSSGCFKRLLELVLSFHPTTSATTSDNTMINTTYIDEDGDVITFNSDEEFIEGWKQFILEGKKPLPFRVRAEIEAKEQAETEILPGVGLRDKAEDVPLTTDSVSREERRICSTGSTNVVQVESLVKSIVAVLEKAMILQVNLASSNMRSEAVFHVDSTSTSTSIPPPPPPPVASASTTVSDSVPISTVAATVPSETPQPAAAAAASASTQNTETSNEEEVTNTEQTLSDVLQNITKKPPTNNGRNLFRSFGELKFLSQIPSTCDRLKKDLERTTKLSAVRDICLEHVELELFLVLTNARRKNEDAVNKILNGHVKKVWELGDQIRSKILSKIGTLFDLAVIDSTEIVALVEAMDVYERAEEQYNLMYEDSQTLHFTDMKFGVLAKIHTHFEQRCSELFRRIHVDVVENAEEQDTTRSEFKSVFLAATELVTDIKTIKYKIAPFFPPNWAIGTLWSCCVAHSCSVRILQQIGGPDGRHLIDLTMTQLLDLIDWIECFREQMEKAFPNVIQLKISKKIYFDSKPNLLTENREQVNMEAAIDSLAWVNNMFWDVHKLAQNKLLTKTKKDAEQWLDNVYAAVHTTNQTSEGRLISSLCEDVSSLFNIQLDTFRKHLSKKSNTLVKIVCLILSCMKTKQLQFRNNFIRNLESCCFAANDFARMSEKSEEDLEKLIRECNFTEDGHAVLKASMSELLAVYTADAVRAAQITHIYIFEPIHDAIGKRLFGTEWEENLTNNELALTLVHTLEDYITDLDHFLDPILLKKSMEALVSATVMFYFRYLFDKAENHSDSKKPYFKHLGRGIEKIAKDILVMREFFEGLSEQSPFLTRVIEREFETITILPKVMDIAAGLSVGDVSVFIRLVHKKVGNVILTKRFFGDLWNLVNPMQESNIWEIVDSMEDELQTIDVSSSASHQFDKSHVHGLRLNEIMMELHIESKRVLPITNEAAEQKLEIMKKKFKMIEPHIQKRKLSLTSNVAEKKLEAMKRKSKGNQVKDKDKLVPRKER